MYKQYVIIAVSIVVVFLNGCQDCKNVPISYQNYNSARRNINYATGWQVNEYNPTSESSWMRGARYLSCDGKTGYFVYKTNRGKEYIHQGVPISVWTEFDSASSKGAFYNRNIKGKYRLILILDSR